MEREDGDESCVCESRAVRHSELFEAMFERSKILCLYTTILASI